MPIEGLVVDFYCHELMLAIEIYGNSHDNPHQVVSDEERHSRLKAYGVEFIRISDAEVKQNLDGVMRYLAEQVSAKQERSE